MANVKWKEKTWMGSGNQAASTGSQSECIDSKISQEGTAGLIQAQVQKESQWITSDRACVTEKMQMQFWQKKVKVWEWTIPQGHGDKLALESRAMMDLEKSC